MLRLRPLFRRFAFALAAAQLLAYAAAPVIEASTERSTSQVTLESRHSSSCVQVHQAATCLACQLLTMTAQQGQSAALPCTDQYHVTYQLLAASMAPHAPPRGQLTRAPPRLA